ncbi:O-methyltransferase [Nanoarchaeota archaeon]
MESNKMFSNVSPNTGKFIYSLAESVNAKNILEIGTSNGYSAYWLAHTKAKITTIELSTDRSGWAKENLKDYPNVNLIQGDALDILPELEGEFDFVFIDAMKEQYLDYLKLILDKLKDGCTVVADNVGSHQEKVQNYLDYVKENFKSNTINMDKGLEVTIIFKRS